MTSYLPKGDDQLKTAKNYLKLSQLKEGENKIRFVKQPIAGWIDWNEKKPIRSLPENKPKKSFDPTKPFKAFWACYVWDYSNEGLYVLEITQAGVLNDLRTFAKDEDWGDLTGYDVKITKKGSGMETKYSLTPLPHKPMPLPATQALKDAPVRLEALYEGGDPWNDLEGVSTETGEVQKVVPIVEDDKVRLMQELEKDKISLKFLDDYITKLSILRELPKEEICKKALLTNVLPSFKRLYAEFVSNGGKSSK